MTTTSRGFTVIELIVVILVAAAATVLFFVQKNNVEVVARDNDRKSAINAMYYGLEEVYYKSNNFYPEKIEDTTLISVDPAVLTDPSGNKIGSGESDYRYEPVNCTNGQCKSYTLRAVLENEKDFVKESRNR